MRRISSTSIKLPSLATVLFEANTLQIYPASFRDTNNDGYGDVRGIIEMLDYLKSLGGQHLYQYIIYHAKKDGYS